jgi:hypothetical protein
MEESLQAANLIIGKAGKGERFSVKHWGFTFRFQVCPITTEQIILIGRESAKMKDIPPDAELFPGMLEHAKNLRYAANSVAIAVLSSNWKRRLFKRLVSRMIKKAPLEDVFTLYLMINKQSNPVFFYRIMALAMGLNKMTTRKPKAETVGSDESQ